MKWHIVAEEGNPKNTGVYLVVLIYNEWNCGITKQKNVTVDTRWFGNIEDSCDWAMNDQPDTGLVWTEQTGSLPNESVYAWLEIPESELPRLPEGLKYKEGDSDGNY